MNTPIHPLHILLVAIGLGLTFSVGLYTAIELNTSTENNSVQACRSQYAADVNDARDARQKEIYAGLVDVGHNDQTALKGVADRADKINARIDAANDRYRAANQLSKVDPAKFLRECRRT